MLWNENVGAIRTVITNEKDKLINFITKYLYHLPR